MKIQSYSIQKPQYVTAPPTIKFTNEKKMSTDTVEISVKGKGELNGIEKIEPSRLERLEQLKASIKDGTYEINAKEIAEEMVNFYSNKVKK